MGPTLSDLSSDTDRTPPSAEPDVLWRTVLGSYLRGVRTAQGRILTDIAAESGVSPQYLSEIERGRKEPSSEILSAVSGALGVTLLEVTRGVADVLERASRTVPVTAVGGIGRSSQTYRPAMPGRAHLRMVS